jgi:hypothetical protein
VCVRRRRPGIAADDDLAGLAKWPPPDGQVVTRGRSSCRPAPERRGALLLPPRPNVVRCFHDHDERRLHRALRRRGLKQQQQQRRQQQQVMIIQFHGLFSRPTSMRRLRQLRARPGATRGGRERRTPRSSSSSAHSGAGPLTIVLGGRRRRRRRQRLTSGRPLGAPKVISELSADGRPAEGSSGLNKAQRSHQKRSASLTIGHSHLFIHFVFASSAGRRGITSAQWRSESRSAN